MPMKMLLADIFQRHPFINASVVDQDVDLSKGFLCFSEEPFDVCLFRHVGLHRDCFSAANSFAMPAPIPFEAPVTTAIFPFSFPFFIFVPFIVLERLKMFHGLSLAFVL